MTHTLEDRLRATLNAVAATTEVPPAPTVNDAATLRTRSTRRRRVALTAATIVAVVAVGDPVAAAAGVLPGVTAAFAPWHGGPSGFTANDHTGRMVLTTSGPGGQPMQIYDAQATNGGQCVTLFLPEAAKANQVLLTECTARNAIPTSVEAGASYATSAGTAQIINAPKAAYVTLADGISTRRLPVADSLSGVWLPPADFDRTLTLTSFGPTGTTLGHFTFDPRGPWPPRGG